MEKKYQPNIADGIYRVKVPTPQSAGVHDIEITGVVLKNGKTVDSKYKFTVDVLKSMPEVKSVNIDNEKQPPEISVDIKDDENAITGGKIIIKDKFGNIVFEQELTKENLKDSFKLENLEGDTEYNVEVETYYDLDSNNFGDIAQNSGTTTYKQTVKLNEHIALKKVPTAKVESNITREPTEEGVKNIRATLEIIDEDKTIREGTLKAILKDPEGNQIDEISLDGTEKDIEFTSNEVYKAGTYTIEILASYEVEDGKTHENETIGTGVVASLIYATIEKADSKYYVEKGEDFDITYTIKSNTQEEPSSIVISGNTYTLVKNSDGTYKVTIKAPDNAGITDYSTERLIYANDQISSIKTTTIDVLKNTIPVVSALSFDTKTTQKPLLTFNITDSENTFISGKVKLTAEGKEPIEFKMNSIEDTSFELTQIEELEEYKVEVEITYDLDSNKGQNVEENRKTETLATGNIQWIKDYEFSLSDYKLDHIDTENKKIYVTFNSTNASNKYIVKTVDINGIDYDAKPNGGNSYIVEIPYEEPQKQELILNEVILDNLQGFKADDDFTVDKVIVFKTKPTATVQANVSEDNKTITVQAAVIDDEQIITNKKVRLTMMKCLRQENTR